MDFTAKAWIVGIAVSLVLAIISYLIEHGSGKSVAKRVGIGSALNTALLCIVLTAIIDGNFDTRAQLEGVIPRIKSPSLQAVVNDIVELDRDMASTPGSERVREITIDPLRQILSRNVSQAKQGVIVTDSVAQTINLASDLMREARARIVVTSYILPSEWWTATDYPEKIRDAPKRVEDMERIFIVDNEGELATIRDMMLQQRAQGVRVRFVQSSRLDPNLRRDFIVIDNYVAGEILLDEERRFKEGRFYTTKTIAQDYDSRFKQIGVWAQDLPEEAGQARAVK